MPDTINQQVAAWARSRLGQSVGRGECWDLPDHALRGAGARTSTTTGSHDDYVWGQPIDLKDAIPGDVLQFRAFVVTITTDTDVSFQDGSGFEDKRVKQELRPHHSAIIDQVAGGGLLTILEQHVKPLGKKVQRHVLYTRSAVLPPATTFKSVLDDRNRRRPAKVTETVTIVVSGKVWAYRPVSAGP